MNFIDSQKFNIPGRFFKLCRNLHRGFSMPTKKNELMKNYF